MRLIVETIGVAIVAVGALTSTAKVVIAMLGRQEVGFTKTRLSLARYLALGLEFQLAADILSTAIAPSWEQIGKLGAIAVIRPGLNYFLMREMKAEKTELEKRSE